MDILWESVLYMNNMYGEKSRDRPQYINKNKKTHSGKDKSTGSYKSRYSLRTLRRTYCEEVMSYGYIKKGHCLRCWKKVWKINQDEQGKYEKIVSKDGT